MCAASAANRSHEPRVDCAREHRHHHVEGALIGDSQSVDLVFRYPGSSKCRVDLASAAVNDHESAPSRQRGNPGSDSLEVVGLLKEFAA